MELHLIDTGYFYADGGAMFGAIPKTAWSRRYKSNEQNGCALSMRSMLIITDDGRHILIDNGAGDKHLKQLSYYQFFQLRDLDEELKKRGSSCERITDVVLTHLHFDHCGYTTRNDGKFTPAFPNATHWISRSQWENFLHPHPLEKESFFLENLQSVDEAGQIRLIDKTEWITYEVELRLADGHTPGQIVPYIHSPKETYVFAGDVIPLAASVSPEWISAYDLNPVVSYNEKIRLLEEAVQQHQLIIFCHDAYTPYSYVKKAGNLFIKEKYVIKENDISYFEYI